MTFAPGTYTRSSVTSKPPRASPGSRTARPAGGPAEAASGSRATGCAGAGGSPGTRRHARAPRWLAPRRARGTRRGSSPAVGRAARDRVPCARCAPAAGPTTEDHGGAHGNASQSGRGRAHALRREGADARRGGPVRRPLPPGRRRPVPDRPDADAVRQQRRPADREGQAPGGAAATPSWSRTAAGGTTPGAPTTPSWARARTGSTRRSGSGGRRGRPAGSAWPAAPTSA